MVRERPTPVKTACRLEVVGKITSMDYCETTASCLVTTILNGAHVFNVDDNFYGANLSCGLSAHSVESYPYTTMGEEPLLSSCFFNKGALFAVGSSSGTLTVVSRCSRAMAACYTTSTCLPIRSLKAVPDEPGLLLICTEHGAEVIDVERSALHSSLVNPVPGRSVAAVALNDSTYVVANYDGMVLLYDRRSRTTPSTVLSVLDQVTCLASATATGEVSAGTVGGRVFTLRCIESRNREQAFATGTKRSPIRSLAMHDKRIAAGDLSGRLVLLDTSDVPDPTVYWSAETLLQPRQGVGFSMPGTTAESSWLDTEMTAVTMGHGTVWMSLCSPHVNSSHVVAIPS